MSQMSAVEVAVREIAREDGCTCEGFTTWLWPGGFVEHKCKTTGKNYQTRDAAK